MRIIFTPDDDLSKLLDELLIKNEIEKFVDSYPRDQTFYVGPAYPERYFNNRIEKAKAKLGSPGIKESSFQIGINRIIILRSEDKIYAASLQQKVNPVGSTYWEIKSRTNITGLL